MATPLKFRQRHAPMQPRIIDIHRAEKRGWTYDASRGVFVPFAWLLLVMGPCARCLQQCEKYGRHGQPLCPPCRRA